MFSKSHLLQRHQKASVCGKGFRTHFIQHVSDACYQTPTCDGQSNYAIQDTHGLYSGHGTTNTLYTMIFPQPDAHFPNFNNGWHQLNWAFTRNDFDNLNDPPVTINLYTGIKLETLQQKRLFISVFMLLSTATVISRRKGKMILV